MVISVSQDNGRLKAFQGGAETVHSMAHVAIGMSLIVTPGSSFFTKLEEDIQDGVQSKTRVGRAHAFKNQLERSRLDAGGSAVVLYNGHELVQSRVGRDLESLVLYKLS